MTESAVIEFLEDGELSIVPIRDIMTNNIDEKIQVGNKYPIKWENKIYDIIVQHINNKEGCERVNKLTSYNPIEIPKRKYKKREKISTIVASASIDPKR